MPDRYDYTDLLVSLPPNTDTIQAVAFSPNNDFVAAASWDNNVRVWRLNKAMFGAMTADPVASYEHAGPALGVDFLDNTRFFSAGADWMVMMGSVEGGQPTVIGEHKGPIMTLRAVRAHNLVVTGGVDNTVCYWDHRQGKSSAASMCEFSRGERVYALDVRGSTLVVITSMQRVHLIDLRKPNTTKRTMDTPLRFQLRSVGVFADEKGWVVGSVQGRCAIQHADPDRSKDSFAYRCHRINNNEDVFVINAVSPLALFLLPLL